MLKGKRLEELQSILEKCGFATVDQLSEELHVSKPTIRRDLIELVNQGLIIRSHGGAMSAPKEDNPYSVVFRKHTHYREKLSLARAAVKLIPSNAVIFIDASTSAGSIVEFLKNRHDLIVVTNSLVTAARLKNYGIRTYCLGGEVIAGTSAVGGPLALESARSFNVDLVFFSSSGVNDRGMIVDGTGEEAELIASVLKTAEVRVFLCDSSKFGVSAAHNLISIADVSYLITDAMPPEQYPRPRRETILVK